jgi:tripartite motif-containing protein 43/48/49/64/77
MKHSIMLFDNMRNLIIRHDHKDISLNSDRYNYSAVWEAQGFTSGKHYWKLDVDNSKQGSRSF